MLTIVRFILLITSLLVSVKSVMLLCATPSVTSDPNLIRLVRFSAVALFVSCFGLAGHCFVSLFNKWLGAKNWFGLTTSLGLTVCFVAAGKIMNEVGEFELTQMCSFAALVSLAAIVWFIYQLQRAVPNKKITSTR